MNTNNNSDINAVPFEVPFGNAGNGSLLAERYGAVGDGNGWDNPYGVTVIAANGNSVKPENWHWFRKGLVARGLAGGGNPIDISFVSIEDGEYYDQDSHSRAVEETARLVHGQAAGGHKIWLAGWSRGGISAVRAADDGRLAEDGVVSGIMTMASPTTRMDRVGQAPAPFILPASFNLMNYFSRTGMDEMIADQDEMQLAMAVGATAMERKSVNPVGVEQEAAEIITENTAAGLTRLVRGGLRVATAFYEGDTIVPPGPHIAELEQAGFMAAGGVVLRFAGTHFRPPVDGKTHQALVSLL